MYNLPGVGTFAVLGALCAVAGWGFIEFVLWLFSFVHVSVG
jgi:hypothetical protein